VISAPFVSVCAQISIVLGIFLNAMGSELALVAAEEILRLGSLILLHPMSEFSSYFVALINSPVSGAAGRCSKSLLLRFERTFESWPSCQIV